MQRRRISWSDLPPKYYCKSILEIAILVILQPGVQTQLNKLDKLIDQLQQQESGYLGELMRLTVLVLS